MSEIDWATFAEHMVAKARDGRDHGIPFDDVVRTVVADCSLVADGSLTVEDYAP